VAVRSPAPARVGASGRRSEPPPSIRNGTA
jgi:hypothetical protein